MAPSLRELSAKLTEGVRNDNKKALSGKIRSTPFVTRLRFKPACTESGNAVCLYAVCLALDAAGAGALHQAFDFLDGHAVEVAGDGVLQAGSGHGELKSLGLRGIGVQAVD